MLFKALIRPDHQQGIDLLSVTIPEVDQGFRRGLKAPGGKQLLELKVSLLPGDDFCSNAEGMGCNKIGLYLSVGSLIFGLVAIDAGGFVEIVGDQIQISVTI